jgi:hypothetical protein
MNSRVLAAAVAVTVLAGSAVWWTGREVDTTGPSPTPTVPVTNTPPAPTFDGPARSIEVYIDGWSLAALGGQSLTWYDNRSNSGPVSPTAMTADAIRGVLAETPQLIERALARIVTPDTTLTCTTTGCSTDGGPIDLDWLATPSGAPAFGEMYEAWNVTAGLYQASVAVPAESPVILVGTSTWGTTPLFTGTDDEEFGAAVDGRAGYGMDRHLVAAGAGAVFYLNPGWLGQLAPVSYVPVLPSGAYTATAADLLSAQATLAGTVGDFLDARFLDDGIQTWVTSPTTGCGGQLLCVPVAGLATVSGVTSSRTEVQNIDGNRATVVWQAYDLTWSTPKPAHIRGMWNGGNGTFANAAQMRAIGFNGYPPLVRGPQTMHVRAALLVFSPNSEPLVGAIAFSNGQLGYDDVELTFGSYGPGDLPALFGGEWSRVR